jgi:hypothetical protein
MSTNDRIQTAHPSSFPRGSVQLQRIEKLLALHVAFVILQIDPGPVAREELCLLCVTMGDIFAACTAMRDASGDRMTAALQLLRARKYESIDER